jgi:REP element-mobilizing transposase RayT
MTASCAAQLILTDKYLRHYLRKHLTDFQFVLMDGHVHLLHQRSDFDAMDKILRDIKTYFNLQAYRYGSHHLWQKDVRITAHWLMTQEKIGKDEYQKIIKYIED